jgi:hypothetical protein
MAVMKSILVLSLVLLTAAAAIAAERAADSECRVAPSSRRTVPPQTAPVVRQRPRAIAAQEDCASTAAAAYAECYAAVGNNYFGVCTNYAAAAYVSCVLSQG